MHPAPHDRAAGPGLAFRASAATKFLLITVPTLLVIVLVLEFGVFRLVVAVDSTPFADYDRQHQLLKYWPRQSGVRYPDRERSHPVPYTINDDGWNSFHQAYPVARDGRRRIAVVGDSYVEAFQVEPHASMAAGLEQRLGRANVEVFSFGISGAPLSHDLHVARYVASTFHPDVLVVLIVHNDFVESYQAKPGRFSESFLRIALDDSVREIAPASYQPLPAPALWLLGRSATARAVYYAWRIADERRSASLQPARAVGPFEANVDVGIVEEEEPRIRRATKYLFAQFSALERECHCRVVLAMDAPREGLYDGRTPAAQRVFLLNRLAREEAGEAGLEFVDLTEAFTEDYSREGRRFEFATDNHWNAHGHEVAARHLAASLGASEDPPRR